MPQTLATPTTSLITAARTRLLTVPGLPALRAWENIEFIPPSPPAMYIEDHILGGPEGSAALGDNLYRGTYIYQITIVAPGETGVHPALTLADAIGKTFRTPPAITIAGSSHPARVVQVRIGPSVPRAPASWSVPVSLSLDMDF
jgi:hypothetical protein